MILYDIYNIKKKRRNQIIDKYSGTHTSLSKLLTLIYVKIRFHDDNKHLSMFFCIYIYQMNGNIFIYDFLTSWSFLFYVYVPIVGSKFALFPYVTARVGLLQENGEISHTGCLKLGFLYWIMLHNCHWILD